MEAFFSFLYDVIQTSWNLTAITVKYLLIVNLGYLIYKDNLNKEKFIEVTEFTIKILLIAIFAVSIPLTYYEVILTSQFKFLSELIALGTLIFVFWRY